MPYKRVNPMTDDYMVKGEFEELIFTDVEPIHKKVMENERYHGHFSVCQKLRDIYIKTDDPEIKEMAKLCMAMTKKMHQKLKWYRDTFNQT